MIPRTIGKKMEAVVGRKPTTEGLLVWVKSPKNSKSDGRVENEKLNRKDSLGRLNT